MNAPDADGASVHRVGRWTIRIAPQPALLLHGMRHDDPWTRERATYERGTIVEVYDPRYSGPGFTPLGQFVTSYGTRTLLSDAYRLRGGLDLHGGVPAWKMDRDEVVLMLGLIVMFGDVAL